MQYTLYTKIDGTVSDIQTINSEFLKFKFLPPPPPIFSATYIRHWTITDYLKTD